MLSGSFLTHQNSAPAFPNLGALTSLSLVSLLLIAYPALCVTSSFLLYESSTQPTCLVTILVLYTITSLEILLYLGLCGKKISWIDYETKLLVEYETKLNYEMNGMHNIIIMH